jgi:chromosomal replication initiation ATPase DnaA
MKADRIIRAVSEASGTTLLDLRSGNRKRHISLPRQLAMYLIRRETGETHERISKRFNINRTASRHAYSVVDAQLKYNQTDTVSLYNETLSLLE